MSKYQRVRDVREALNKYEVIAKAFTDAGVVLHDVGDSESLNLASSRESGEEWHLTVILSLVAKDVTEISDVPLNKAYAYEVAACLMTGDLMVLDLEYSTETRAWNAFTEAGPKVPAAWKKFLPLLSDLKSTLGPVQTDQVPELLAAMAALYKVRNKLA